MQVPPPPSNAQRTAELSDVHALTDNRTPELDAKALELDKRGGHAVWGDEARLYRQHVGFLKGVIGTIQMDAAMAATAISTYVAKSKYDEQRPFELDPTITPLGSVPHDPSYPSGHSSAAAAAATVLEHLWPEQRGHYEELAASVEWARVYSGVHFPSDVRAGDSLGRAVAVRFTGS
ncbi:MAG: PA-phosphatase [Thermoleophilia bacterium]|nr:PA-phosphatase [Thermoleophilia bacterium]